MLLTNLKSGQRYLGINKRETGNMKKNGSSKIKYIVILGYVLVVGIMAIGLIAIYNNLVDFSNKKSRTRICPNC
jgi:hypothetical protein